MSKIDLTARTAPGTPTSGKGSVYFSSVDKKLHVLDDAGLDTVLGEGGVDKLVVVQAESDLPAPSGQGQIELEDGYTYLFTDLVTVTSQIRVNNGDSVTLIGGGGNGGVQSNLGTSASGFLVDGDLLILGGRWYSLTGGSIQMTGTSNVITSSAAISGVGQDGVNLAPDSNLMASNTYFAGSNGGLYISDGDHGDSRIQLTGCTLTGGNAGLYFDPDAEVVRATFSGCRFDTDGGTVWIFDESSGVATTDVLFTGCMFRDNGELDTITTQQDGVTFRGCTFSGNGFNTRSYKSTYGSANTDDTTFASIGQWSTVELSGGSTASPSLPATKDFTVSLSAIGEYTYTGASNQLLELTASLDVTDHSGTIDVDFGWTVDGSLVGPAVTAHMHGGAAHEVVVKSIVPAQAGKTYVLQARNQTNTNAITVRNGTITAVGMG